MNHKYSLSNKTILQLILSFVTDNRNALLGMTAGLIMGYIHWYYWGCYWGVYPLSAECWTNCLGGLLFGGFIGSLFKNKVK